jgi:hypothetical protein
MNNWNIPENDLLRLKELLGEEKAESFLDSIHYNYRAVRVKILKLEAQQLFERNEKMIFLLLFVAACVLLIVYVLSFQRGIS